MKLVVKTLKKDVSFDLDVNPDSTLGALKQQIEKTAGHAASSQKVIFAGKKKASAASAASSAQATPATQTSTATPAATAASTAAASEVTKPTAPSEAAAAAAVPASAATTANTTTEPSTSEATPMATEPTPAAAAAESSGAAGDEREATIRTIMEMGFPREQVVAALAASFGNGDQAVNYLMTGIPDWAQAAVASQQAQSAPAAATTPAANASTTTAGGDSGSAAAPASSGTATTATPMSGVQSEAGASTPATAATPVSAPSTGASAASAGGDSPFAALLHNPQFTALRFLVQSNPSLLQPLLQRLAQTDPQLLRAIQENQNEFINIMNQPVTAEEREAAMASLPMPPGGMEGLMGGPEAGGFGAPPPGTAMIQLTEEEAASVERLQALGFDRQEVLQAFLACDKDEQLAANFLLENMQ